MNELRRDPFSDGWVLFSAARAERPRDFSPVELVDHPEACPFCRGHEQQTPHAVAVYPPVTGSDPTTSDWQVRVVPNKFPAVADRSDANVPGTVAGEWDAGLFESRDGVGVHEVIIESPQHVTRFTELTAEQFRLVFHAFRDRFQALRDDARLAYALIFKNAGADAGASLAHVHSQLLALPLVPLAVQYELTRSYEHTRLYGRSLMAEVLDRELHDGARIVANTERFVVFCPFASRFPAETWIVPHAPESRFEDSPSIEEAAELLRETLVRIESLLGRSAYNFWLRTAPLDDAYPEFRWRIEIAPRASHLAGFELASGYFINPLVPERAAAHLRESTTSSPPKKPEA